MGSIYGEKLRAKYGTFIDSSLPVDRLYQTWNITGNDSEKKDLFIHDALSKSGFVLSVHETIQNGGYTNIDGELNGCRCEFKSPEANPNDDATDRFKFVQRNVHKAVQQFRDEGIRDIRIVLSNYHTGFFDEDEVGVFHRLVQEAYGENLTEALFITKSGIVLRAK